MELKQCGRSGLYLSALGLGTLTWGRDTDGPEAHDMLKAFVDAGGNLVECSPAHGDGMGTASNTILSTIPSRPARIRCATGVACAHCVHYSAEPLPQRRANTRSGLRGLG